MLTVNSYAISVIEHFKNIFSYGGNSQRLSKCRSTVKEKQIIKNYF